MILISGVDEFPSGPWTEQLAARFADRTDAELTTVPGGPAADHVARLEDGREGILLFGHAPPRGVTATLRAAPCPVVVAPAGISAGDWGEVVLGLDRGVHSEAAAATAGVLAARIGATLRVVVLRPDRRCTGWQLYDVIRRVTDAAERAVGAPVTIEHEVREGPPADELLDAANDRDSSLVVVAADPRPTWFDALRPSFTSTLLHRSRELVVVVPPAATPPDAPRVEADLASVAPS